MVMMQIFCKCLENMPLLFQDSKLAAGFMQDWLSFAEAATRAGWDLDSLSLGESKWRVAWGGDLHHE